MTMTREEYLILRDKVEIPKESWFEYYKERGGKLDNIEDFWKYFVTSLARGLVTHASGGFVKQITFKSALDNFYEYYNKKHGV